MKIMNRTSSDPIADSTALMRKVQLSASQPRRICNPCALIGYHAVDAGRIVCFYAFMRTTVELPPELMKKAKAHAAARGESLKTLLTRAVASELGRSMRSGEAASRVRLPLFGNPKRKPVNVSGRDIELALSDDEVKLAVRSKRSRRK
jgi:hypothetical protein